MTQICEEKLRFILQYENTTTLHKRMKWYFLSLLFPLLSRQRLFSKRGSVCGAGLNEMMNKNVFIQRKSLPRRSCTRASDSQFITSLQSDLPHMGERCAHILCKRKLYYEHERQATVCQAARERHWRVMTRHTTSICYLLRVFSSRLLQNFPCTRVVIVRLNSSVFHTRHIILSRLKISSMTCFRFSFCFLSSWISFFFLSLHREKYRSKRFQISCWHRMQIYENRFILLGYVLEHLQ